MIESPHNPQIRAAVALHKRSERDRTGQFLIEGRSEIRRAIAAGISVETLFSTPGIDVSDLAGVGRVLEIGEAAFQRLAYGRDGLVAVASVPSFGLHRLRLSAPALVLVVTSIEKPGNLGAMLRSADATGAAVIIADPLTDLVNPNVVRASLGTLFTVPVATTTTPVVIA
ncbi:MAG: TrmH family RNA methyltransferase, partial [Acidimicrobiia bacterium]